MSTRKLLLAATASIASLAAAASAAVIPLANGTVYTDRASFESALGFAPTVVEDFESYGDVDITEQTNPYTFTESGIVLTVLPDDQAEDTRILDGALRLSTNRQGGMGPANTNANMALLDLPFATNYVSFDFTPQGVGNDTGTQIGFTGTGDTIDADLLYGGTNGNVDGDTGYTGFFGYIGNMDFTQVVFMSENSTLNAIDDDFAIDNISSEVPVPAAAPLMIGGLAGVAAMRRRRRKA